VSPRAPVRRLTCVLLGLAGALAGGSLARALVPWPYEYGLRAKVEYFAEHRDEFDTLFLGASTTYYGIVPEVFDAEMASRGYATRSFNFGVGGMTSVEADYVLRRLLELEPGNLRWLFVEAQNWEWNTFDGRNTFSLRNVNWHDLEHTRMAWECLRNTPTPAGAAPGWKWNKAWLTLRLMSRKYSGAGLGKHVVRRWLGLDPVEPSRADLDRARGYVNTDELHDAEWDGRRAEFTRKLDEYPRANIDAANRGGSVKSHRNGLALVGQIRTIRAAGAEAIYYTGPFNFATPVVYRLADADVLPAYFGHNRPADYPALYDPANHTDPNHLNGTGARIWTRILASEFADWLDAREP